MSTESAARPAPTPVLDPSRVPSAAPRPSARLRRHEALAVGLLTLAGYLLLRPRPGYATGSFGDDAAYVALGKALAAGAGYREMFTLGHPQHVRYPPGLPVLLAVFWRVFGSLDAVLAAAALANACAIALASMLIWQYGRRLGVQPITLALFALGPLFFDASLQYSSLALSEPYMLALWAGSVVVAGRLAQRPAGDAAERLDRGNFALLGLLLGLAALVRTQALTLLPGFLIALALVRRPWRQIATTAITAGALGGLPLLLALQPGGDPLGAESYSHYLLQGRATGAGLPLLEQVAFNARAYVGWFPPYFAAQPLLGRLAVGLLLAAAVFGGVRLARRHPELVWPPVTYMLVLLVWPGVSDRLALPALPFLGVMAAYRVDVEVARARGRWRLLPLALLLGAGLAVGLRQIRIRADGRAVAVSQGLWPFGAPAFLLPWTDRYIRASDARLVASVPLDAVAMVDRGPATWLYTGRTTVPPDPGRAAVPPGRYLADRIRAGDVDVVVVGSEQFRIASDVAALRRACPGLLVPLPPDTAWPALYEVRPVACGAFGLPSPRESEKGAPSSPP